MSWVVNAIAGIIITVQSLLGFSASSAQQNPIPVSPQTTTSSNDQADEVSSKQTNQQPVGQSAANSPATCPNTFPPGYTNDMYSNPSGEVTIAQGARTPQQGLTAFQDMLTLIATKQGESKQATDDSIVVNLAALNSCRMQLLVDATVNGADTTWAGSLLTAPDVPLTSSQSTSLMHIVENSKDALAASAILNKYNGLGTILDKNGATLSDADKEKIQEMIAGFSAADKEALQAVVTKYGGPSHTATQSSVLSTYTNSQYDFSVQYPADLTVYSDTSSYLRAFLAFTTPNLPSTSVFAAIDKTTGALFVVGVSNDPTQVANCLVAPQSDPAGGAQISNVGKVVLNGTTFLGYKSESEALGFVIDEHDYLVLRGNTCLAIREVPPTDQSLLISTLQGQSQLTGAQQAMLQQAQQAQEAGPHFSAELNAMVQSFQFK